MCGSAGVLPIVYGLPGDELAWAADRGEVVLGGCIIESDAPTRECTVCGHAWRPDEEQREVSDQDAPREVSSGLRISIGGRGPVVAESDATGWRLIVRGQVHASGASSDTLHIALRDLALQDRELARVAFGVVMNCAGAWEDEYTEEHGEDALAFDDWMERIEAGGVIWVNDDGELETSG